MLFRSAADAHTTHAINEHMPSGFCAYTTSRDPEHQTEPVLYSGPNVMEVFFDHILTEQRRIACIMDKCISMLPLMREEQSRFDAVVVCPWCKCDFTDDNKKVRHHDHMNGIFIEGVCNNCNMQIKYPKKKTRYDELMELFGDDTELAAAIDAEENAKKQAQVLKPRVFP